MLTRSRTLLHLPGFFFFLFFFVQFFLFRVCEVRQGSAEGLGRRESTYPSRALLRLGIYTLLCRLLLLSTKPVTPSPNKNSKFAIPVSPSAWKQKSKCQLVAKWSQTHENCRELESRTEKKGSCGTQVQGVEVAVTKSKRTRWNSTEPVRGNRHMKTIAPESGENLGEEDCRQFNKHSERVRVSWAKGQKQEHGREEKGSADASEKRAHKLPIDVVKSSNTKYLYSGNGEVTAATTTTSTSSINHEDINKRSLKYRLFPRP